MKQTIDKLKLLIDLKTFIVIIATVGSISFWGSNILNKIDTLAINQTAQSKVIEDLIIKRDTDHSVIDKSLAILTANMQIVMKKLGL